jgi:hypothetical protein
MTELFPLPSTRDLTNDSTVTTLLVQLLDQYRRFLQVCGVKALGEPAVDRRQQVVSFLALTLLVPQACQAHGGSQLQRSGLLTASDREGLVEAAFRLGRIRGGLPEQ